MYSFNNQNANPCYDSSPEFGELPPTVIPTGYPFQFNYLAIDNEMDSLVYDWGHPLISTTTPITSYSVGYSYNSPFPGTFHNQNNVPATLDPQSGVISVTSFTPGCFITKVNVSAYKNGVKVAEIGRELMIALVTGMLNSPPQLTAPFINPVSGLYTNYSKTVYAGDTVSFNISVSDFDFLPNQQPQSVTLSATSPHFGANYTSATIGCLKPPCATLNPPLPVSAVFAVQSTFRWQTDGTHLGQDTSIGSVSNTYNFLIKVSDDFCPVPAFTHRTISITVLPRPAPPSPRITCLRVQPTGNVEIRWLPIIDSANAFEAYRIYSAASPAGPFTLRATITNINADSFLHTGAGALASPVYYFIRTRGRYSGVIEAPASDTLSTIFVSLISPPGWSNVAQLSWTAGGSTSNTPPMPVYSIYRGISPAALTLIDTTSELYYNDTTSVCAGFVNYRVEMLDTAGFTGNPALACSYVSNSKGINLMDMNPPPAALIENLSYQAAGDVFMVSWLPVSAPDLYGYIVYRNTGYGFLPLDTVYGANTSYTDSTAQACQGGVRYKIHSTDSCWNINTTGLPLTVFEMSAQYSASTSSTHLSWSVPMALLPAVNRYTLFMMKNYGPWVEYISTSGTSFQHNFPDTNSVYCYYVKASDSTASKTVNSCPLCVQTGAYTDVERVDAENAVRIFPNPAKEEWRVVFGRDEGSIRIELFEAGGRRVHTIDKSSAGRGEEVVVSAAHLTDGVYLMIIRTEGQIHRKVVILNR
jgi:hypothetical protein